MVSDVQPSHSQWTHPSTLADLLCEVRDRLEPATRRFMENGYSAEFSDVIVHTSDRSHRANADLGTTAFTIGNHICFSRGAFDPGCRAGRLLLAHELAHVVQSRLGAAANPRASIARRLAAETEADAAALSVLRGRRPVCSVSLPVGELSAWGPAGHYYTVYYVLLAAGVDNAKAARLAFYTQMPDEVVDLDAEEARYGYFDVSTDVRGDTREDIQDNNRKNIPEVLREKERCWLIQMGLHCLTGRDSWAETEARRQALAQISIDDDFAFGLALHRLGDSFAHRQLDNERLMYSSWLGHAVERPKKRHHMPDEIHMRPTLYRDYVRVLFHLACAKWPDAKRRAIWEVGESPHGTKGIVSAAIETISTKTSETAQIETIRKLCRETLGQGPATTLRTTGRTRSLVEDLQPEARPGPAPARQGAPAGWGVASPEQDRSHARCQRFRIRVIEDVG